MALPDASKIMLGSYPSEARALMALGYLPGVRLGVGGSAEVFSVINTVQPDVLVAKVTNDDGDASRLHHFMQIQSRGMAKNVVKVFGVYKVGWRYLVLTERLSQLTGEQSAAWYEAGSYIHNVIAEPFSKGFWKYSAPKASKEHIMRNLEILNVPGIRDDLSLAGYRTHVDWHQFNVMNRPGHGPVIIDLGGMG